MQAIEKNWSGLRGSNPLPPPWQGGALPDELNPHNGSGSEKCRMTVHKSGASGRNRTIDTGIFSPLLYRLSYRGVLAAQLPMPVSKKPATSSKRTGCQLKKELATRMGLEPTTSAVTGRRSNQLNYRAVKDLPRSPFGGNNRARTYDPLLVRQMLSQLSYAPI